MAADTGAGTASRAYARVIFKLSAYRNLRREALFSPNNPRSIPRVGPNVSVSAFLESLTHLLDVMDRLPQSILPNLSAPILRLRKSGEEHLCHVVLRASEPKRAAFSVLPALGRKSADSLRGANAGRSLTIHAASLPYSHCNRAGSGPT